VRGSSLVVALSLIGCRATSTEPAAPLRARLERQLSSTRPVSRGAVVIGALDRLRNVRFFVTAGAIAPGDATAPGEDTVFEIGSVTKAFTGTLLGEEVARGRLRLDDSAQQHLGAIKLPVHAGGEIRLVHLATYTSGLPFMPTNWITVDEGVYTDAMWREFLAGYTLPAAPGAKFIYGNVGFGVLGDVLAARENTSLEALFRARIFEPLGMEHTWFLGSRPKSAVVAQGIDDEAKLVALDRDKPLQAGCCAIESTAGDLLRFLDAALAPSALSSAFDLALARHIKAERIGESHDVGLGWFLPEDQSYAEKGGVMKGYRSAVVVDRKEGVGVVVLAADALFPADALARRVRAGLVLERALPPLPLVGALPKDAVTASVRWESGLSLLGWTAPSRAARGTKAEVCLFFRTERAIDDDFRVFVHGEGQGAPRVRADHDPVRPTSDWPVGTIVRDCFALAVPAEQPLGAMTLWLGLFSGPRMKLLAGGDGKDRARGPTLEVAQ
jgi:CubicO group peptidase (beta-lactamase class C family)